ncbi:cilia- and flagella-associated protein 53 isoform X3 [Scophthalmus maximus]|uniref:cilia- and flagella-associated protein 53 isoform X3 n=1 Tax=Scophthalmus maximus TaxID=52904 RepID=UPI001FA83EF3|nr:cilia- and flagella-associated protein 53 isoform X3 [Scophthalmus maximus]
MQRSLGPRRSACREVTGAREVAGAREVTGAVGVRVKSLSWRPGDPLTLERERQDAARDKVLEFTREQRSCDVKNSWLQRSDHQFLRRTVDRRVRAAVAHRETHVDQRRRRLQQLLEAEQQQLLQEMELTEPEEEKQAKMEERLKTLRERRERERQELVSEKLELQFRDQCDELRSVVSRRREQEACRERDAQLRTRQEQLQQRREEERLFQELWEADGRAKQDRERQREEAQQRGNTEQLSVLRTQVEEAERRRLTEKELKEEEDRLMLQQLEEQLLQEQQSQQQQKHRAQQNRRRELDHDFRLKMKRLAREQQDEQQLDMSVMEELLRQETDCKQEGAQRKVELKEELRRYREFLWEEKEKVRRAEEEAELLIQNTLKETWTRKDQQNLLQTEARNRLRNEVMEARRLQIQHKVDMNEQKQLNESREREEMNREMEEMKVKDDEETRRMKQACERYQLDLGLQLKQQQQRQVEQRAQSLREEQQNLIQEQIYQQKINQLLSRPSSYTSVPHPFRRTRSGSRSPTDHINLTST